MRSRDRFRSESRVQSKGALIEPIIIYPRCIQAQGPGPIISGNSFQQSWLAQTLLCGSALLSVPPSFSYLTCRGTQQGPHRRPEGRLSAYSGRSQHGKGKRFFCRPGAPSSRGRLCQRSSKLRENGPDHVILSRAKGLLYWFSPRYSRCFAALSMTESLVSAAC
jgi:hypothetical protein